ncbi:MAG: ParA family protein [Lachnospiraceae bacterium]|nr:ParA family protein [Lachnospiraceae bacterium]
MNRIIAIANQKGGVGKTTTAINLAAGLAGRHRKVLAIDIDPQGNMTSGLGIAKNDDDKNIYSVLCGDCEAADAVVKTEVKRLDLLPSHVDLAGAEIELIDRPRREYLLKEQAASLLSEYDYVIIDCPPALSILTINALTTANTVLVPIQCEFYALEGLSQLIHTIDLVKDRLNPELSIEGVVFTMFDSRTNLSQQVVDNVRDHLDQHIYRTVIPRNVRLAEAPSFGQPIQLYDKRSSGAMAYDALAKEVDKRKL